jgi:ribosome biogenesis protein Tsr3
MGMYIFFIFLYTYDLEDCNDKRCTAGRRAQASCVVELPHGTLHECKSIWQKLVSMVVEKC